MKQAHTHTHTHREKERQNETEVSEFEHSVPEGSIVETVNLARVRAGNLPPNINSDKLKGKQSQQPVHHKQYSLVCKRAEGTSRTNFALYPASRSY